MDLGISADLKTLRQVPDALGDHKEFKIAPHHPPRKSATPRSPAPPYRAQTLFYAGCLKSLTDIVELLKRNPEADLKKVQAVCDTYRLSGLREIIAELPKKGG